ncbi:MAG: glutamate racemase [Prevotellaceae bacterium]|jgi:glutamate racemase|nr:glutamate racemase [Prevotellaceae bacterium]
MLNLQYKANRIGIFDSGVGGLSVLREVVALLPRERVCYVADAAHCPYGSRPADEVLRLSLRMVRFLLDKDCKLIVVACNTATAAAINALRKTFPDVPFVGMEPAVKPAAAQSKTCRVGILATAGTLQSRLFNQTKARYAAGVKLHVVAGNGLVELVELGREDSPEALELLRTYLQPMLDGNVDELVLGCTHYPFLQSSIEKIAQGRMSIINPAPAVAVQVKRMLEHSNLLNDEPTSQPFYEFFSTGNVEALMQLQKKHLPLPTERRSFQALTSL